jgi:metal-dependent amidase/aminoacylase/carboxypeptidase family protein
VHPIITKGGDLVNVVPADVSMELMVRGRTLEAITDAERKVNRALRAGALGVGAKVRITTLPGYLPYQTDPIVGAIAKRNAVDLVGPDAWLELGHLSPSSDMGDISQIMPAVQPEAGGAVGTHHAADFALADREAVYVNPSKLMASMLVELLGDGARAAQGVLAGTTPRLARNDYLALMRGLDSIVEYDEA